MHVTTLILVLLHVHVCTTVLDTVLYACCNLADETFTRSKASFEVHISKTLSLAWFAGHHANYWQQKKFLLWAFRVTTTRPPELVFATCQAKLENIKTGDGNANARTYASWSQYEHARCAVYFIDRVSEIEKKSKIWKELQHAGQTSRWHCMREETDTTEYK